MLHLITGGNGYLGSLITERLLVRGERVRVVDIWDDPQRPADTEYIQCDIRDRDRLTRALHGVDVVHHNAALVPLNKGGRDFEHPRKPARRRMCS